MFQRLNTSLCAKIYFTHEWDKNLISTTRNLPSSYYFVHFYMLLHACLRKGFVGSNPTEGQFFALRIFLCVYIFINKLHMSYEQFLNPKSQYNLEKDNHTFCSFSVIFLFRKDMMFDAKMSNVQIPPKVYFSILFLNLFCVYIFTNELRMNSEQLLEIIYPYLATFLQSTACLSSKFYK